MSRKAPIGIPSVSCFLILLLFLQFPFNLFPQISSKASQQSPVSNPEYVVVLRPLPDAGALAGSFSVPTAAEITAYREGKTIDAYRALSFRKFRKALLAAGLPFEPNVLLRSDWRMHLKNYPGFISKYGVQQLGETVSNGIIVADSLILPSKIKFEQDTLILARQIFFRGNGYRNKRTRQFFVHFPAGSHERKPASGRICSRRSAEGSGIAVSCRILREPGNCIECQIQNFNARAGF